MSTRALLEGLAEHLDAAGIGVWSPAAPIPAGATAIIAKAMPPTPDRVVVLTPYTVSDSVLGHAVQGIQVRTRGKAHDPLDVDDLDDVVYQLLHGARDLVLGGVLVALIERASHATLGVDGDHRTENTANYYAHLDAPTAHTLAY